jgi:predicted DNA-binding WGR domain protein
MAAPIQLPLFPDQTVLTRIRPERDEWRFYRLAVWLDLFGRALLACHWGRIGTQGRVRLDPHPDAGAAICQHASPGAGIKAPPLPPASGSTLRTVPGNTSLPASG